MFRLSLVVAVFATALALPASAQRPPIPVRDTVVAEAAPLPVPKEMSSVTEHTIRIDGQVVPYRATAATMLLRNGRGEPIGSLYYTAYTRTDVKDVSRRPLAFLYNGGPGSASAWLHMGAFGPRRIVTADAAPTPPAPYQWVDNASSLIDVADLVFIDPIGTGFSRVVGKGTGRDFWGIDEDAASLADFISHYVTQNARWNSPKYLIGESYGTTRSAVLVNRLQRREGMDFNGVVLISAVLDFETLAFAPGHDIGYALYLPSYAATAAYHGLIPKPQNLATFLDEVRRYALGPYLAALSKGGSLSDADRATTLQQLSRYTGLSEDYLAKADLRVNLGQFRAELQRRQGLATGRLDSRFDGPMGDQLAETADYDPQSTAISSAYTAAINSYLRDDLKFTTDERYSLSGGTPGWNWTREGQAGGGGGGRGGAPYVGSDLAQALLTNPNLRVQIENGYYDLATPFFAIEYTIDHLAVPATARAHVEQRYYEAGHMMYVLEPELVKLKANIARLIAATSGR